MGEGRSGMRRGVYAAWAGVIVGVVLLQSVVHLIVVLGADRVGTLVDLDRSNGLPDLASTVALGFAAVAATVIARSAPGGRRVAPTALAIVLTMLTVADLVHDGAHASSAGGFVVIGIVVGTGILLAAFGMRSDRRVRSTLIAAGCFLVASFLVDALDWFPWWIANARGDPVRELQIVAKEGLELLGWALVALALWDAAVAVVKSSTPIVDPQSVPATMSSNAPGPGPGVPQRTR